MPTSSPMPVVMAGLLVCRSNSYRSNIVAGVSTSDAGTHGYIEAWNEVLAVSLSAVNGSSGARWQHPRIIGTTGEISHTRPSDYTHYGDTTKVTGELKLIAQSWLIRTWINPGLRLEVRQSLAHAH